MKKLKHQPVSHYNEPSFKKPENLKRKTRRSAKMVVVDDEIVTTSKAESYKTVYKSLKELAKTCNVSILMHQMHHQKPYFDDGWIRAWKPETIKDRAEQFLEKPVLKLDHEGIILPESFREEEKRQQRVGQMVEFAESELTGERSKFQIRIDTLHNQLQHSRSILIQQSQAMTELKKQLDQMHAQLEQERRQRAVIQERSITITERVRHFRDE